MAINKRYKYLFFWAIIFLIIKYVYLSPSIAIYFDGSANLFKVFPFHSVEKDSEHTIEEADTLMHERGSSYVEGGEYKIIKMNIISEKNSYTSVGWGPIDTWIPYADIEYPRGDRGDSLKIRRDEVDYCRLNVYANQFGKIYKIEKSFAICIQDLRCIFNQCQKKEHNILEFNKDFFRRQLFGLYPLPSILKDQLPSYLSNNTHNNINSNKCFAYEIIQNKNNQWLLKGSFSLNHLYEQKENFKIIDNQNIEKVVSMMPLHIAITHNGNDNLILGEGFVIPIYNSLQKNEEIVNGYFQIDISHLIKYPRAELAIHVYLDGKENPCEK